MAASHHAKHLLRQHAALRDDRRAGGNPGSNDEFNVCGHGICPRVPTRARPRAVEVSLADMA